VCFVGLLPSHDGDVSETGQSHEARAMLADICGWLTEGFDPADLILGSLMIENSAPQTLFANRGATSHVAPDQFV